ncbi:hypothetical protein M405DRAFT_859820, partial [Rhizopogon salebrosus TDB-379]
GVENKYFKKERGAEDLDYCSLLRSSRDPELAHQSTPDHRDIFGFTNLQTTLLGRVNGFAWIVAIWTVTTIAFWMPDSRAYVVATYFMSPLAAVLMIEFLPWSNQIGLLFGIWMVDIAMSGFVISLAWLMSVAAGHTKRVTTNAIMLSGFW